MDIIDFDVCHVAEAQAMALSAYEREYEASGVLPVTSETPALDAYVHNGMSVAALENGTLCGFLCACPVFDNAFGSTDRKGTVVSAHAHGVTESGSCNRDDRERVYARLYEAAAGRWAKAGAVVSAVTVYAHDREAVNLFFQYGFGLRLVDAARAADTLPFQASDGYVFGEINKTDIPALYPLFIGLIQHLARSPVFLCYGNNEPSEEDFVRSAERQNACWFAVSREGRYVAYMKVSPGGEHFITYDPSMDNISGAYCLPEYRGTGLFTNLLAYVNNCLKAEGYAYLGVDYESFNPTARGFWPKFFTPYTATLVRVIDGNYFSP